MRKIMFAAVFASLAAGAFAQAGTIGPMGRLDPFADENAEIAAILDRNAGVQLGTMTVGEIEKIAGEISIVMQKAAYVRRATMASFVLPGAGQFMAGDAVGGSLFLIGDIAVAAGTLVGAYFLLPANVQFGAMDYLNTPMSAVRTAWESNTVMDYLPSVGVAAGGMAAQMLLRWLASSGAEAAARRNIESGKVTFQPVVAPLFGHGGMVMGMGLRFGY